ncbi:choline transporter-like protein 1 [Biomphalaria glabrata]|uniref:Choline transporter-like protein n=1 Tax=Biomphalaria glabrata TaxID=6526 RepID=A0A9W3ACS4_BIOGL|nr:choline transporter-like protein 1 [Biomphalaria glabrata]
MKLSLAMTGCCYPIKDAKDQKGLLSKPRRNRGCTDILVFLVFVFFICGLIFLGAFSISKGDPFRLVYGTDSFGNTCDEDNSKRAITGVSYSGRNLKGRPYLFFMNIKEPDSSMRICVNKCPENDILTPRELYDFSQQTGSLLCRYDLDLSVYVTANGSLQGPCPVLPIHKSESLLNWCIPRDMVEIDGWQENNIANNVIAYINKSNVFQKVLRDLYASWTVLTALCFLAVAFSILMVLLIRFLASVIIWLILTLAVLASMAGSAFIWWTFISNKNKLDMEETLRVPLLEVDINSENSFLLFSVVSTVLTIILLLILVAMRKRISHVVLLLKEAGSCVSELPLLLLQPLWTLLLLIMFFVYWVTVLAYLSTSETPTVNEHSYVMFTKHETITYFWWYHLVGLIWVSEYIINCQSFVISGAVARWYFTRDKSQLGFPILGTIGRLIVFHQGSVAFGSLLTLVKLPKMMLLFITKKLKSCDNCCAQGCAQGCCCWCVEKCLRYINTYAYCVVAISGKNFCTSAKKSYYILVSNTFKLSAMNSVCHLVMLITKVAVMAATTAVSVIWFKSQEDLHFYAIPVLVVAVFSYYIAHCFLSVYQLIIDALMLCYCEDRDMNDGSLERPFCGSKGFMIHMAECSQAFNDLVRSQQRSSSEPESEPAQV